MKDTNELIKALGKAYKSYHTYQTSCGALMDKVSKFMDLSQARQGYEDSLTIDYSPSDGIILIDEHANNFSVVMIVTKIKNKGIINYRDLLLCQI